MKTLETRTVLSIKSEVSLVLGTEWLVCVDSYEATPYSTGSPVTAPVVFKRGTPAAEHPDR